MIEVASKPPSRGLFNQEPPSELVIDTERHPVCGYDGWKASRMLANDNSSHSLKRGVPQKVRFKLHGTKLPQIQEEQNTANTI